MLGRRGAGPNSGRNASHSSGGDTDDGASYDSGPNANRNPGRASRNASGDGNGEPHCYPRAGASRRDD